MSKEEEYYIDLLAHNNQKKLSRYKEQCLEFIKPVHDGGKSEVKYWTVKEILDSVVKIESNQPKHAEVMEDIIEIATKYRNEVERFTQLSDDEKILQKEQYVSFLKNLYDEVIQLINDYRNFSKKNQTQSSHITALKNKLCTHSEHTDKAFAVQIQLNITNEFKKVDEVGTMDFVDVRLGKSFNYQIEIEATGEKEEDQYKVYNNAALFQLEAVYNEYRGYINRKIEQSYILNDLYKAQLQAQFPTLFPHTIDSMTNTFFTKKEDLRHEVLGKLVHDIVVPTVKARRIELLDL